jgi:hypothetical protein
MSFTVMMYRAPPGVGPPHRFNPDRALLLALTQDTDRLLFDGEACELVDPRSLTR